MSTMKTKVTTDTTEVKDKTPEVSNVVKTTPLTEVDTKKLDIKQQRYVKARVKGINKQASALIAGASTPIAANKYANRMSKNVNVQQAIDNALELLEATPEFAVRNLKQIAEQNEELGAKRLASKDILELWGWRKNERSTVSLTVNQAFFGKSRITESKE